MNSVPDDRGYDIDPSTPDLHSVRCTPAQEKAVRDAAATVAPNVAGGPRGRRVGVTVEAGAFLAFLAEHDRKTAKFAAVEKARREERAALAAWLVDQAAVCEGQADAHEEHATGAEGQVPFLRGQAAAFLAAAARLSTGAGEGEAGK